MSRTKWKHNETSEIQKHCTSATVSIIFLHNFLTNIPSRPIRAKKGAAQGGSVEAVVYIIHEHHLSL